MLSFRNFFTNTSWIEPYQFEFNTLNEVPVTVFEEINKNLERVQSSDPLVSIVIAAWNEEVNLIRTLGSLSRMESDYPFEIIVVDNNSTDRTAETISRLRVRSFFEARQGAGPARQRGQEHARGKFILTADADCLYPSCWINEMMKVLTQDKVVCVYGRYSFISEARFPRWQLAIHEILKDIVAEIRHVRMPYFNCFGISMGYIKELGLKEGFISINRRGEDGQLCLDLMKYGSVKAVRSNKARVWTAPRTLKQSGKLKHVLSTRIKRETRRLFHNFFSGAR